MFLLTCRIYGSKGFVLGKKKGKKVAASAAIHAVMDMQCLHVLSKHAMPAGGQLSLIQSNQTCPLHTLCLSDCKQCLSRRSSLHMLSTHPALCDHGVVFQNLTHFSTLNNKVGLMTFFNTTLTGDSSGTCQQGTGDN